MSSLAVLALAGSPADRKPAVAGGRWLLMQKGSRLPWLTRILVRFFPERNVIELDDALIGWPWTDETFSWIEPTAYALLALKRVRSDLPAEEARGRIEEAERMILDRTCDGGGWNYGNTRVFDEDLWPYPDTTAWALIALQDRRALPEVRSGLDALDRMLRQNDSLLALSTGLLCRRLYDRDPGPLADRIGQRLDEGPAWADTRSLALVALALDERPDPFGGSRA